jgi:hypothetical protein
MAEVEKLIAEYLAAGNEIRRSNKRTVFVCSVLGLRKLVATGTLAHFGCVGCQRCDSRMKAASDLPTPNLGLWINCG